MYETPMNMSSDLSSENGSSSSNDASYSSIQSAPNLHLMQQPCFLRIIEEPQEKFRYRYKSEKGKHGGLTGINHKKNKKTCPTVKLENYKDGGSVYIIAGIFTKDKQHEHVHELRGNSCVGGEAKTFLDKDMIAKFTNISIQYTTKDDRCNILTARKRRKKNSELNQQEKEKIFNQIKEMNMNCVRLGFQAFVKGQREPLCQMVFSQPICNQKSLDSGDLKIVNISKVAGSRSGNEEVFLLCEKVKKENIQVRFFEPGGNWEDFGKFSVGDVHHQVAIVFRTPPYKGTNQNEYVEVNVELYRKTDGARSNCLNFKYYSDDTDSITISRNRKRKQLIDEQEIIAKRSSSSQYQSVNENINENSNIRKESNFLNESFSMKPNSQDYMFSESSENIDLQNSDSNISSGYGQMKSELNLPDDIDRLEEDLHLNSDFDLLSYIDTESIQDEYIYEGQMEDVTAYRGRLPSRALFDEVVADAGPTQGEGTSEVSRNRPLFKSTSTFTSSKDPVGMLFDKICEIADPNHLTPFYNSAHGFIKRSFDRISPLCYSTLNYVSKMRDSHRNNLNEKEKEDKLDLAPNIYCIFYNIHLLMSTYNNDGNSLIDILTSSKDNNSHFLKILLRLTLYSLNIENQAHHQLQTSIQLAIILDKISILKHLMNKISKNNPPKYNKGNTCLHIAAENNSEKCLKLIIEFRRLLGIDRLDIWNDEGFSPLHIAVKRKCVATSKLLIKSGANINFPEARCFKTALHLAVVGNSFEMVKFLLEQPQTCNTHAKDIFGKTALNLSYINGYHNITEILRIATGDGYVPNKKLQRYDVNELDLSADFARLFCNDKVIRTASVSNENQELVKIRKEDCKGTDVPELNPKDDSKPQSKEKDCRHAEYNMTMSTKDLLVRIKKTNVPELDPKDDSKPQSKEKDCRHAEYNMTLSTKDLLVRIKNTSSEKWIDVECEKALCSHLDPPSEGWRQFGLFAVDEKDLDSIKLMYDSPTKQLLNIFKKNGGNAKSLTEVLLPSGSLCLQEDV